MDGATHLEWDEAPGLAHVKRDKNEILMCQATATDACRLGVPAKVAAGSDIVPRRLRGRLQDCRRLTHDVESFSLALDDTVSFDAGQFLVLEAPELSGGRAYSMTNLPGKSDRVDFVVKRKPGGGFSDWLFDGMPEGAELSVFGPLGRATFRPGEDKNILCIAGGSGIAGMMAILRRAVSSDHFVGRRGHLFFGIRADKDLFFAEELTELIESAPDSLFVTVALSEGEPDAAMRRRYPALDFATGFVHAVASERMAGQYGDTIGFVAGPPPMVDAALRVLVLEGRLPGQDIRYDKFS